MKITQRTATLEDASLILAWRNDLSAREFSLHSELILNDEHLRWFSARLARVKLEPFWLFAVENDFVGLSRLDIATEFTDKYEISILVDSKQQGKGIGTKILDMTCESFFGLHPNKSVIAKIHSQNTVSQKLFMRAGFRKLTSSGNFLIFDKNLD